MRILGIDPGTSRIGYGLLEKDRGLKLLDYGVIEIRAKNNIEKISALGKRLMALVEKTKPKIAGLEKLYFANNQKTALAVSEARGVIIYILKNKGVKIKECHPGEVKIALTSYGRADKIAVARMVKKILKIDAIKGYDDASDALAIAITTALDTTY